MRQKLIKTLNECDENLYITCPYLGETSYHCTDCKYYRMSDNCNRIARRADYLLANGVIVLPCKVGEFVYVIYNNRIEKVKVFSINAEIGDDSYFESSFIIRGIVRIEDEQVFRKFLFGKTAFLTKEEAEEYLKRGNSNAEDCCNYGEEKYSK